MATYKTVGIVLKRDNFHEADRVLTILSKDRGKLKVIAKGVRKPLSKLGGHLEPFYTVHFVLAEGKSFDTVAGAEVQKYLPKIRKNLKLMGRAYRFGEMLDNLTHEKEDQEQLFGLMTESLDYLEKNPDRDLLDTYFQINLLDLAGYRPELHECVYCREGLKPEKMAWSSSQGGVLCFECCHKDDARMDITPESIKVLRFLLKHKTFVLDRLKVDKKVLRELEKIMKSFICYLSQKELISDCFLTDLRGVNNA